MERIHLKSVQARFEPSQRLCTSNFEIEPCVLESEVRQELKDTSDGKTSGTDDILMELLKAGGDEAIKIITKICQGIWKITTWPKEWKRAVFISFPKNGDPRECINYRTRLHLFPTSVKFYSGSFRDEQKPSLIENSQKNRLAFERAEEQETRLPT